MRVELQRLQEAGLLQNVSREGDGKTWSGKSASLQLCPMYPPQSLLSRHAPCRKNCACRGPTHRRSRHPAPGPGPSSKPAGHGAGTNWHQDNAYFQIPDPLQGTAMWTAVHDATVANGTIRVIPGSYRVEYEHSRDPFSDHHIRCYPPEDEAVAIELPAGGVAFFACGVARATGANNTDCDRAGILHHFVNGAMKEKPWRKRKPGENPWLSGPRASGGEREYGQRVSGTWHMEVKRLLQMAVIMSGG